VLGALTLSGAIWIAVIGILVRLAARF